MKEGDEGCVCVSGLGAFEVREVKEGVYVGVGAGKVTRDVRRV